MDWTIEHSEQDLAALFEDLAQLGEPGLLPAAIERGEGRVVGPIAEA